MGAPSPVNGTPSGPAIAVKVAWLSDPAHHPERPARVEVRETHMSWVFLGERDVYKLKKPVRTTFLDFSTCERRRRDSEREVRLNRRLAGDVYRGTVALGLDERGHFVLGGGSPVDWLVHMRRLPAARMLDNAIAADRVAPDDVARVGDRLRRFYREAAAPVSMRPADYRRRFEEDVEATVAELRRPALRLPRADIDRLHGAQTAFLEEHGGLLESRAERGRIVEGHGDLRPEHVCLLEEPVVIDCLEFDAALRVLDPLDELAYLALECERLGAGWIGRQLLAGFDEANGEVSDAGLVGFYQGFRALVRAKLAAWHTEDDSVNDHDGWRSRACEYLALAVERRGPGPGRVR